MKNASNQLLGRELSDQELMLIQGGSFLSGLVDAVSSVGQAVVGGVKAVGHAVAGGLSAVGHVLSPVWTGLKIGTSAAGRGLSSWARGIGLLLP